ncbi:TetR/AcrR family transcriptional regulator [Amycolatopsis keratiniphila]|uniref:TetR family transcriptional regulator n=1 Tax=Amycolatopsis keratiniphila subsp. keratiniphila TaxID=227715 RepID=A0A1W2LK45_9PSEU|nr:TetR/AcrR family transcriptional regulator [Amycolatopsis keratiniphila]OLZ54887.1 TetR family transcriptional regulator [Amycolatopsis keratiniphila subsp. nogabecina]ONF63223.1 TetR family transcriptional regulator [Amycolatopsis keratiniphila subsp. keratiniphila]SDU65210.1 DNA-binding transcriptional regulator, AcrR family [Amycolatopsis keratiniphila]
MDHPTERSPRPRDRKAQLAGLAAELFRARGFHGVGINDIAAAAGITGPALYRHFADKQAVLSYVVLSGIDDMEAATTETLADGLPVPAQVNALLGTLAAQAVERREVAALWRWEGRHLPREERREIRRRSGAVLEAWSKALRALRPELTADDAELLCWAGLSVFGSVSVHHTSVAKKRFAQILVQLAESVLHVTLPEPSERPEETPSLALGEPSRREQILAAATELFGQSGFRSVSMEEIGAAAGIAGPSVYRHFPSKAALMVAIGHRAADRLALAAERALRTDDERDALRRLAASYVHTLLRTPELLVSFSGSPMELPERDKADLIRVQRDYVARWIALTSEVHPELSLREVKITVHAALTIANDLARTRRVNGRPNFEAELTALTHAVLKVSS